MSGAVDEFEDREERDYIRLPLGVLARLETLDGRRKVEIVDLSQGGAHLLLLDIEPSAAAQITDCVLAWLGFDAFGRVSWQRGQHIGIAFDEPLRPIVIKETRKNAPVMVRRDFDELRNAAKLWASGVHPSS